MYPPTEITPLEDVDVVGFTPLLLAAMNGDGVLVKAMLDAGADPSARTPDGRTALDSATVALDRVIARAAAVEPLEPDANEHAVRRDREQRARRQRFVDDARAAVELLGTA